MKEILFISNSYTHNMNLIVIS